MKKIYHYLLFFLFILISSNPTYCQVSFGIKSGINITTTKNLIEYPRNRIGFYGGGFVTIPLYKKLFLQPELIYSTKGDRSTNQLNSSSIIVRFNYLNLPILFGYKIDQKTSLLFGPELGLLTSARLRIFRDQKFDASKNYPNKFDAALDIGISYNAIKNIGIEVRYCYGFKTLYYQADDGTTLYNKPEGSNRVFQIGINYSF